MRARIWAMNPRRSTSSTSIPRWASSIAADSPTGPPPTISTGTCSGHTSGASGGSSAGRETEASDKDVLLCW